MSPNKGGDVETGSEAEDEKVTGQGGDEKVSEGEEVQRYDEGEGMQKRRKAERGKQGNCNNAKSNKSLVVQADTREEG